MNEKANASELDILTNKLKAEVADLTAKRDSLETQVNTLQINIAAEKKSVQAIIQQERNNMLTDISGIRAKLVQEREQLERDTRELTKRKLEFEAALAKVSNMKEIQENLDKERVVIYQMNKASEEKAKEAAILIEKGKSLYEGVLIEKDALLGREKSIAEKEKFWNDRIGELEIKEKELKALETNTKILLDRLSKITESASQAKAQSKPSKKDS